MGELLEVDRLVVSYPERGKALRRGRRRVVHGASLRVGRGSTVALVGESGGGKSSLARALLGLLPIDSGSVRFDGVEVAGLSTGRLRPIRRRMQIVLQDANGALDPRLTVGQSVAEGLGVHRIGTRRERRGRVLDLFGRLGLAPELVARLPHQLSLGQRQRVGIARALAVEPELLVLDEPVSALDVSLQGQVLNWLIGLREALSLTFLLVSHDLGLVSAVASEVFVMYLGRIVESAPTSELFSAPGHPYTVALLGSVPRLGERWGKASMPASSPVSAGVAAPGGGCAFAPRCPLAVDRCRREEPQLVEVASRHQVACFLTTPKGA